MVDPFIARRHGREEITYPSQAKKIPAPTYGVVLYQEQVIEIATETPVYSQNRIAPQSDDYVSLAKGDGTNWRGVHYSATERGIEKEQAELIFSLWWVTLVTVCEHMLQPCRQPIAPVTYWSITLPSFMPLY